MSNRHRIVVTLAAACALLTPAAPVAATPSPGADHTAHPSRAAATDLTEQRQRLITRIDARIADLNTIEAAFAHAEHLTAEHRGALATTLAAARTGLGTLRATAAAETTPTGLTNVQRQLVDTVRVAAMVAPQVRLTIAADIEAAVLDRLTTAIDRITVALSAAQAAGRDTTSAQATLTTLRGTVDHARAAIAGQADALLRLTPTTSVDAAKATVAAVRTAVTTTRADLRTAHTTAQQLRTILQAGTTTHSQPTSG